MVVEGIIGPESTDPRLEATRRTIPAACAIFVSMVKYLQTVMYIIIIIIIIIFTEEEFLFRVAGRFLRLLVVCLDAWPAFP